MKLKYLSYSDFLLVLLLLSLSSSCTKESSTEPVNENTPAPDNILPGKILDLAIVNNIDSTAMLSWTSPGDDNYTGTVLSYDVRYGTDSMTVKNWTNAHKVSDLPIPLKAGETQYKEVRNLQLDSFYVFGIKSTDSSGNISELSNLAIESSTGIPKVFITIPFEGQKIADLVEIKAVGADDKGIIKVDFYVDTVLIGTDLSPPYSFYWDAHTQPHGTYHLIYVSAKDTDNNQSGSSTIGCVIDTIKGYPQIPKLNRPTDFHDTSFALSWDKNTDNDFQYYLLQYSQKDPTSTDWLNLKTLSNIDDTSIVIRLDDHWNYKYRLAVSDIFNHISYSSHVSLDAGVIIENSSQYANSRNVLLTLVADLADSMMISNFSNFKNAIWEPFQNTKIWNLLSGDGTKEVYVRYKYSNSQESMIVSDDILPKPINLSLEINYGDIYTDLRLVDVSINASGDNIIIKINSIDSNFFGIDWEPYSSVKKTNLTIGPGVKRVYVKAMNDFAIESPIVSDEISPSVMNPHIEINNQNVYTTTIYNLLNLSVDGSNVSMKISTSDTTFEGIIWEPFAVSRPCTLLIGDVDSIKSVFAKFINDFEIESSIISDGIYPLQMNPILTTIGNIGSINYTILPLKIEVSGYSNSDSLAYKLSEDSTFSDSQNWQPISNFYSIELTPISGVKIIYVKLKNLFDNESITSLTIILDLEPPQCEFTHSPDSSHNGKFSFDASNSSDNISTTENIEVRWKFKPAGVYSSWSKSKLISFDYLSDFVGSHEIALQAKDEAGNITTLIDTILIYNNPPSDPIIINPPDNSLDLSAPIVFKWNSIDPDLGDSIKYDVYLDTINPPEQIVLQNFIDTEFPLLELLPDKSYYWRVVARDDFLETNVNSIVQHFTTSNSFAMIAIERDNSIYLTNSINFDVVFLANGHHPSWSPNHSKLAFSIGLGFGIWDFNESSLTTVIDNTTAYGQPSWSPDGSRIAFGISGGGVSRIAVVNPDGSNLDYLSLGGINHWPSWSPLGDKIAYVEGQTPTTIFVADTSGSPKTQLTNGPVDYSPNWSPDGEQIAFHSFKNTKFNIYVMNSDGSNVIELTDNSANDHYPSWSPDGKMIVFVSDRSGFRLTYVMNSDGTDQRPITDSPGQDLHPAW